jgi:hypothetical protein
MRNEGAADGVADAAGICASVRACRAEDDAVELIAAGALLGGDPADAPLSPSPYTRECECEYKGECAN